MYKLINKQYHELRPNTPEWEEHRDKCFNASEIPSVLGCSPHTSRSELLKQKATGEKPEISWFQQRIFDKGHQFEKYALPWAEEIAKTDLFSTIISAEIDDLILSASFDGICIFDREVWEHKQLNQHNVIQVENNDLHLMYRAQMEQQLLLSGAESVLFMVSDGNKNTMRHCRYYSDPDLRRLIIDSWKQFREDLQNYVIPEIKVKPVAADIMQLPALNIQIHGGIKVSNLDDYKTASDDFLKNINTDLKTDNDFATAEKTVKFLKDAQDKIKLVKEQALSQTADIDLIFKTLTQMESEYAAKRLEIDKLVKAEKENTKTRICNDATQEIIDFVTQANERLGKQYITHKVNFRQAIKNKRTITSIESAASNAIAAAKIEINRIEEKVGSNLEHYNQTIGDYGFLFLDIDILLHKEHETFCLLIAQRINEHKEKEKIRLEAQRAKIEQELEDKAAKDKADKEKRLEDEKKAAAQREQEKQDKLKREKEVSEQLNEKVNNLAKNASTKIKTSPKQPALNLDVPAFPPANNSRPGTFADAKPQASKQKRPLTIERVANYIAVKFCHQNGLNPDQIAILIDQIEKGYNELLKNQAN